MEIMQMLIQRTSRNKFTGRLSSLRFGWNTGYAGTATRAALILILAFAFAISAAAQRTTGTPPFHSFGGGPDVIDLSNLNVHYSIPVFNKAGRGLPLSYSLAYDSSVWVPIGAWLPATNWGLQRDTAAMVGYVNVTQNGGPCHSLDGSSGVRTITKFGPYIDSAGTNHSFSITLWDSDCGGGVYTGSVTLQDGMTIKVDISLGTPSATVTLKSGVVINPLLASGGVQSGNASSHDANGNGITTATTSGTTTFTDTLGTAALAISGTAPSPVSYTYTPPLGTPVSAVVTYATYTVRTNFGCGGINEYGPLSNSLVDKVTLADGTYYQFAYEITPGDTNTPHNVTGRIASLRLPTGGTISYDYSVGTNNGIMCNDGTTSGFKRTTPDGQWTYIRSGTSPAFTTTITTPIDPYTNQTNQTVVSFQGNFEVGRQVYQGAASGTPLEAIYTCYNGNGVSSPSSCVTTPITTPFTQIAKFNQFNGGPFAEVNTLYDSNGNISETDQFDFGASTPTRKTTVLFGSYVAASDTCTGLSNNILDHPCKVTVTDGTGNLKTKTTYGYDETAAVSSGITTNHTSVTGSRGNLTTTTTYATSTGKLTRTFKNYDTGNVYQSQDVNGQWTTYTYGACAGAFPTNVSLPLSLTKSASWNCTGGVMTSATDENGQITYTNYTTDPYFWRPESNKDALLNVTNLIYPSLVKSEAYLNFNGTVSTVDALKQLDGLGRSQYTQQKQAQTATNYDTIQQVYDSFGRPYQVTMPYVATSASPGPPSGTPIASTTYYDALGRQIQTIDGGSGQLNATYSGRDVYQEIAPKPASDGNKKRKQFEYDALGRLISVCEITGGANSGPCAQDNSQTGYRTAYIYDTAPNVNSLTVTQNVQTGGGTSQTRTYLYDMLGRLTQETNPETGTTYYKYDSDTTCTGTYSTGNLVKKTDAVGNVTCYTYDQLHRLLSVTYPSGSYATSTDKKFFVYDSATVGGTTMQKAKARLAEAYTCPATGSCTTKKTDLGFSYSARGEVAAVYEKTPNSPSTYYQVSASYWPHGAVDVLGSNLAGLPSITYGATGSPGLDGEGRITSVTASSGQSPLVGVVSYTNSGATQPIGSLTQVAFGSSDYDTFSYDTNTGRLNQYKYVVGATPQTVTSNLTWNANGSLASLAITDQLDSANTQTCNYSHDDLGRIATANCGTIWNQSFGFDPFGNISKSATAGISFLPTYSPTANRYSSVPGCTPSYDANGFATSDCAHSYSWDSAGNPLTIDAVGLTYDALGRMVEQARGSTYTQIVYGPDGGKLALMNGAILSKAFVGLPGGGAAVYTSGGLVYYSHSDWLGSGRLATTPVTRTKYFDVAYGPYGEGYATSGTVELNFTGQTQDTIFGLYDFPFREYNANQGRWPWPDPAGISAVNIGNPQTWNRYAYVGNAPLNSVDPLGLVSDADQYLRGMARTQGLFSRFEFFPIITYGHDHEQTGFFGFVGSGFTFGIRAPGQTWKQCMAANANTYSVGGATELTVNVAANKNYNISEKTSFVTGNGITDMFFEGPGAGDFITAASHGAGSPLTVGRRTSDIMSLNLAGKGGLPQALGSTGAKGFFETAGKWLNFGLDEAEKFAVDAGLAGAESINCAILRVP
jgi:RHS repeat-associated protein